MRYTSIAVLLACLAFIGLFIFLRIAYAPSAKTPLTESALTTLAMSTSTNTAFGYSFLYPGQYEVITPEDGPFGDVVFTQSVFDSKEYAAFVKTNNQQEPPPSLTITVFRDPKALDAAAWINESQYSNYKLSTDKSIRDVTLGKTVWKSYQWDGLYRGDDYVTMQNGYIYVLSNTWMDAKSTEKADMEKLIATFSFKKPTVPPQSAHGDIMLQLPAAYATVTSPITLKGQARGSWYFEGSFPVILVDWDGKIIAEGHASATGDWMSQDLVPFTATLTFLAPTSTQKNGSIILRKDNPSGLPQNDDAIEVPIRF